MRREAAHAGFFYPETKKECELVFQQFSERSNEVETILDICAGIAPHAGWSFSGYTAYLVFEALKKSRPQIQTFIVFGAVHVAGVYAPCTWGKGVWNTPLGDIHVDDEIIEEIVANDLVEIKPQLHLREHSIEVLVPFIQHFFPQAKLVPIMMPVTESASAFGDKIAQMVSGNDGRNSVATICSTDLTHYGTRFQFVPVGIGQKSIQWVKNNNDKRIIDLMLELQDAKIVEEVQQNYNACGGGAIAATLAFAKATGKSRGKLLHYTTSWDVDPCEVVDNFVGYSGIVI
ncbi:AmmeMemoRadiSam system protein B [Candidatus Uabimicrobium sp. HlEnr_7]|uniref:AmmeMemoRadiSam system protein B n=1 Tax=Candidatus Uabimicrobium helgolandensis TaxID=3095367 RepID=UPI0035577A79